MLLEPRFGGPQNRSLQVARELLSSDIDQFVVIPEQDSGPFHSALRDAGVRVNRLRLRRPAAGLLGAFLSGLALAPNVLRLARLFRREDVRVVHANGVWQFQVVIAGRLAGARVLLHLNDTYASRLFWLLLAVFGPLCHGFILAGTKVGDVYFTGMNRRLLKKPVFEIPAPVDGDRYDPSAVEPAADFGQAAAVVITTVGGVNPAKGLEHFIEMARLLEARHGSPQFNIVGPEYGSQRSYAELLHRAVAQAGLRNLRFVGPRDDVPAVLKATDIYVCSSVSEASPISVWEGMAMERAVVSTDVGDVARYITDGENGFIVPVADAAALAEKVGILVEDEQLRQSFGPRARAAVVPELDVATCAAKHRAAYRNIAGLS